MHIVSKYECLSEPEGELAQEYLRKRHMHRIENEVRHLQDIVHQLKAEYKR